MARGSVFMTPMAQAIRLPQSVRFSRSITCVDIERRGCSLLITPSGRNWAAWFEADGVSRDFMQDRAQPEAQERAAL